MKRTQIITLCGVCAALSVALMFGAYFPYLTYAVPALAGAVMLAPLFECGRKYALLTYLASLPPVLLFCETEAKLLYVFFLGYYPVLKAVFERLRLRPVEILLKGLCFNAAVAAAYAVGFYVVGLPKDAVQLPFRYGAAVLWLCANAVFWLYDVCLSRLAVFYERRLHAQIRRLLRR